ncbi:ABC transporter ATP-binding protein/permease [Pelagibacteraceae bacterium]|nr:ABC transporter ATP-binding protein/permease [Pelagibacteraceae bacterium]
MNKIFKIFEFFSKRRKYQSVLLVGLMIITSLSEMIGIGLFYPILLLVSNPQGFFENQYLVTASKFLNISEPDEMVLPFLYFSAFIILVTAIIRVFAIWCYNKFAFAVGLELGYKMYLNTLYQPYEDQIQENSSFLIDGVTRKLGVITFGLFLPLLNLLTAVLILLFTSILIMYINYIAAISLISIFLSLYLVIFFLHKNKIEKYSKIHAQNSSKIMLALQEGLQAKKEIIIDNKQKFFANLFKNADRKMRMAEVSSQVIASSPRFIVEGVAMILLIALLGYLYKQSIDIILYIPLIGTMGLAAQRTLPLFQVVYFSLTNIKHSSASYDEVIKILNRKVDDEDLLDVNEKILFKKSINLKDISFRYKTRDELVIKNCSITINKNSIIGFLGESGSGKSTLIDIILCLLNPTNGKILIDDIDITNNKIAIKKWQKIISHVPQEIFISDDTIKNNICLGEIEENIDYELLNKALKQSELTEFIDSLEKGYDTFIGEKGSHISGGQKQRIGIARSLYKKSEVIIFDEATNALDLETEEKIIKLIKNLSKEKTIIIVTHNRNNLYICDDSFRINKGKIIPN